MDNKDMLTIIVLFFTHITEFNIYNLYFMKKIEKRDS